MPKGYIPSDLERGEANKWLSSRQAYMSRNLREAEQAIQRRAETEQADYYYESL